MLEKAILAVPIQLPVDQRSENFCFARIGAFKRFGKYHGYAPYRESNRFFMLSLFFDASRLPILHLHGINTVHLPRISGFCRELHPKSPLTVLWRIID